MDSALKNEIANAGEKFWGVFLLKRDYSLLSKV